MVSEAARKRGKELTRLMGSLIHLVVVGAVREIKMEMTPVSYESKHKRRQRQSDL